MAKKDIRQKPSWLERTVWYSIVGLIIVLPLLYIPGWAASYVTSKQYVLIGVVDILTIFWVWLLLNDSRYRFNKKAYYGLLPLLLFLISLTISALTGISPAMSFFSSVESGTGLIVLYHAFLLACMVVSFVQVRGWAAVKSILQATLVTSTVLAVATFYTGNHGLFEINSAMLDWSSGGAMMGNALLVGAYFIFAFFFAIALFTTESKMYKKVLYTIGAAVLLLCPIYFNVAIWKGVPFATLHSYFVFGEARIAAVSLLVGVFIALCIWLTIQKRGVVLRAIGIIGLILSILLFLGGLQQIITPSSALHRFFVEQSGNRIIDWQESIQGIKARPLFGWGPENFHAVYQQYLNPIIFNPEHGSEVWALHPHNNTIEVLIDGGVVGFAIYIFVLVSLFIEFTALWKKERITAGQYATLIGMLIAFILQQQMIYDSIVSYMMFFCVIAIVTGLSASSDNTENIHTRKTAIKYSPIIGWGIVIVMLPVFWYAAYLPGKKVQEFQTIADAHSDQRVTLYQHLFHSSGSYAINTDVEFFTSPLFYSYSADQVAIKNNPLYKKIASEELQTLLTTVQPVWQQNQYDYHLTLSLIQIENLYYYLTGDPAALTQAEVYAKQGMILSPTDPQIYVNYAQTVLYEKNPSEAKALLDKALQLNPTYQSAIDFRKQLQ